MVPFCKKTGGGLVDHYGLGLTRGEARSRASIHDWTAGSCGGGRRHCQRRWTVGAERRRAGGESKLASRPPFRTGIAQKRRGRLEELTGILGREVEAPVEEIGAARRSSDGSSSAAALRTREREGKWCGVKRRWCRPFYNSERSRGRGVEAVARGRWRRRH
jgi:hypothetical protein